MTPKNLRSQTATMPPVTPLEMSQRAAVAAQFLVLARMLLTDALPELEGTWHRDFQALWDRAEPADFVIMLIDDTYDDRLHEVCAEAYGLASARAEAMGGGTLPLLVQAVSAVGLARMVMKPCRLKDMEREWSRAFSRLWEWAEHCEMRLRTRPECRRPEMTAAANDFAAETMAVFERASAGRDTDE